MILYVFAPPVAFSQSGKIPSDCSAVREQGHVKSGQYVISPQDDEPSFRVYCDMDTDGGNWTVGYGLLRTNTYHVVGVGRRQVQHFTTFSKMSTFWNVMTIFGITMRNAFK